jgi:hypothetical protein
MTLRERIARAAENAYCRTQAGDIPQTGLFENVADAVLAEIAAAGMVLVPREPTEAMLQTGCATHKPGVPMGNTDRECPRIANRRAIYRAMLSAAPAGGE